MPFHWLPGGSVTQVLDPNWFYSSLAQSAAAIVGLLGGIFASRLQDRITNGREQRITTIGVLNDLHVFLSQRQKSASEYLKHANEQIQLIKRELSNRSPTVQTSVWFTPTKRSSPATLTVSSHTLRVQEEQQRDTRVLLSLLNEALNSGSSAAVQRFEKQLTMAIGDFGGSLTKEAREILGRADDAARELRILNARCSTGDSWVLWACLLTLSIAGVVFPLALLSAYAAVHKLALLGAFSLGLLVLLGFVLWQVRKLGRLKAWDSVLPPDDPESVLAEA